MFFEYSTTLIFNFPNLNIKNPKYFNYYGFNFPPGPYNHHQKRTQLTEEDNTLILKKFIFLPKTSGYFYFLFYLLNFDSDSNYVHTFLILDSMISVIFLFNLLVTNMC